VSPSEALAACTKNGADIFNLSSRIGAIEPGMSATLTFINSRKFSARFFGKGNNDDILRIIIEDFDDSDVTDLMINGEFVYKDRKILFYDIEELIKDRNQLTEKAFEAFNEPKAIEPTEEYKHGAVPPVLREDSSDSIESEKSLQKSGNIKKTFGDEDI
jgi:Imidazolonepropionase and related amidohydrolases